MVVDDLHIECVTVAPNETDSPLVIDSDAVLTCPITLQFLESV